MGLGSQGSFLLCPVSWLSSLGYICTKTIWLQDLFSPLDGDKAVINTDLWSYYCCLLVTQTDGVCGRWCLHVVNLHRLSSVWFRWRVSVLLRIKTLLQKSFRPVENKSSQKNNKYFWVLAWKLAKIQRYRNILPDPQKTAPWNPKQNTHASANR